MIACASRLETLELFKLDERFQVVNHPNLKSVKVERSNKFEIIGARSLETLHISGMTPSCFRVSSTPNLKVLHIEGKYTEDFMKLISKFPSLESITYDNQKHTFNIVRREIEFRWSHSSNIFEIDASGVDDFINRFLTILCKLDRIHMIKLVPFLYELSEFRVTLHFTNDDVLWSRRPPPAIEHLKLPSHLVDEYGSLLDSRLQKCHPKFMSVTRPRDRMRKNDDRQFGLKAICKQLVERARCILCEGGYIFKCWHDQLKDVKLVTRFKNGDIREDEVIDVSEDMLSSLVEGDEVRFRLSWH
ncbi:hypothetical protein LINPERHAP2_LOCUS2170 [Linum perenne]